MKHHAFPARNVLRFPVALVVLLALAGCVDPGPSVSPEGPEPDAPSPTPEQAPPKPRTLPVLLVPEPAEEDPGARPSPTAPTAAASPAPSPSPTPTATPEKPRPPPPEGPPFQGLWEHDHELPERVVTVQVAPGFGATDLLVGLRPDFAQGASRCDAPHATLTVTSPSGVRVAEFAHAPTPASAQCGARLHVRGVGFEPGAWEIAFRGRGDAIGFVAAGDRANVSAGPVHVETTHDFTRPERTTYFTVPPFAGASDLLIAVGARARGEPCPADSVRIIVRDPSEKVVARIEIPSEPLPTDCARASVVRDVVLAPGRWSVQWGGSGQMEGSLRVEPAAP